MADRGRQPGPDPGSSQHKSSAPRVRLSCEMCRQRKIKCDKLSPCTNCQRFGAVCVPVERVRLPRGRSGRPSMDRPAESDDNLRDRVSRIEQLLGGLASGSGPNTSRPSADFHGAWDREGTKGANGNAPRGVMSEPKSLEGRTAEQHVENAYWKDLVDPVSDACCHKPRPTEVEPTNRNRIKMYTAPPAKIQAARHASQVVHLDMSRSRPS